MSRSSFPEYLRLVPTIIGLSLDCASESPYPLFKSLSEKATDGDAETFRILPALEHLKLTKFNAPYRLFVDVITTRWRMRERRLKSITLSHCLGTVSDFPKFNIGDDPAILPSVWNPVETNCQRGASAPNSMRGTSSSSSWIIQ